MTVRQLVRQGRYADRGPLGMLRDGDDAVCARAMADVGVGEWADRPVDSLSGGERQRVRLAMALAQDTRVLLLDEPTTYLDLRHQLEVMQTVVRLREERGLTVVMVLHDLGHAARFAERIVALRAGAVAADGPPAEVVTPALLAEVLGVAGRVGRDPEGGWPVCYPDHPLPLGEPLAK
jgi:iron complex transport system ATP-binding protein